MAQLMICAEFLRLRNKTSGAFETGLTVQLLPDGSTAPGDLITLTENAGLGGQYDFGGSVTNGKYDVYVGGSAVMLNGEQVSIYVFRGSTLDTLGDFDNELLDQTASTSLTETTIDISSFSYTSAPDVHIVNKSDWNVYVKSVTASSVVIGLSGFGSGSTATFDLFFKSND